MSRAPNRSPVPGSRTSVIEREFARSNRLSGRVVLVTGASRGIGQAIAQACASEGACLALASRSRKLIHEAAAGIPGAFPFVADVTSAKSVGQLFKLVRAKYGRLDVLVNNAGVFTYKPFIRTTLSDWETNIRTNLTSLYLVTRAALPLLRRSGNAHIINVLSVSSRAAFPNCSAYCASKFGALGLTRVLAEELRAHAIRVSAILPGSTSTRMSSEFDFPVDRRRLLQPADVGAAVLSALLLPARAAIDEILLTPSQGSLAEHASSRKSRG
jgi:NAD(P)-dependent dehydrogenase (short-subunit alcohol dehydrogenase family)